MSRRLQRCRDVDQVCEYYNAKGAIGELELRFDKLTPDLFAHVFDKLKPDGEISTTMRVSNSDGTAREITFGGGVKTGETFVRKQNICVFDVVDIFSYKVAVSTEETLVDKPAMEKDASVRFKIRMSVEGAVPNWRIDLTAVKTAELGKIAQHTASLVLQTFPPNLLKMSGAEVAKLANNSYELELEYIGKTPATKERVDAAAKYAVDLLAGIKNANSAVGAVLGESISDICRVAKVIHTPDYATVVCRNPSFKMLLPQVISLTKSSYYGGIYPPEGMYVAGKTDGVRALVLCEDGVAKVITAESVDITTGTCAGTTILDCELSTGKSGATLHVFDIIMHNSKPIHSQPFSTRIATDISDVKIPEYKIAIKPFVKIQATALEAAFKEVYKAPHNEGLILIMDGNDYAMTKTYKWKPLSHNTIDFLIKACPKQLLNIDPYKPRPGHKLWLLFTTISLDQQRELGIEFIPAWKMLFTDINLFGSRVPIQFMPAINPLAYICYLPEAATCATGDAINDGDIIEMRAVDGFDTVPKWEPIRVRSDRKDEPGFYGNNYKIASDIYLNYIDIFQFEDLYKYNPGYFEKNKSDIYVAPNKYRRFLIKNIFSKYLKNAKWVIDAAAGRGADLHLYKAECVENLLAIDIDPTAISELVRRRNEITGYNRGHRGRRGGSMRAHMGASHHGAQNCAKSTTLHALVADLRTDPDVLIPKIIQSRPPERGYDAIVINFAIHYLCDTDEHIRDFLITVSRLLAPNGIFMFTTMDGESIVKLLETHKVKSGESWTVHTGADDPEAGVVKYSIRRLYDSDKLTKTGQQIAVLLPMSGEMKTEPLCNIKNIISIARKMGLDLVESADFSVMYDAFARAYPEISARLTPDDKLYNDLHSYAVFKRKK
ncbi:putative mRNA-capping enzyme [Faustovirus]|nr:putative mRNA-capping enzyme [Faustovirus]QJX73635.1 putative mRNA-capping enzyme [Faustovirus]